MVFFTTELLLCCTARMCIIIGTKHEVYTCVRMRTLRDSALEMGRVRWHGAINSSLYLHIKLTLFLSKSASK